MHRIGIALLLVVLSAGILTADEYVSGYYRNNGTYVQGYWRSDRDDNYRNNHSSWGNTNPHTGSTGYNLPSYTEYANNPSYYNYTYRPVEYVTHDSYSSSCWSPTYTYRHRRDWTLK